jgi:hypothetical protein
MTQAQFRAKSGAPVVVNDDEGGDETSPLAIAGSVQATITGASRENWFWKEEAGAAETGSDSGKDCFAAQQPVLPQWQEATALATLVSGACAGTIFVHASSRLQIMTSAVFMN